MLEPVFTETLRSRSSCATSKRRCGVAHLATDRELGVITEIFSGTPGADLKPDTTYP